MWKYLVFEYLLKLIMSRKFNFIQSKFVTLLSYTSRVKI